MVAPSRTGRSLPPAARRRCRREERRVWAADATTGKILWSQAVGPGSSLGGIEWGPATDGRRIYIAEMDYFGIPYGPPGHQITSGSWLALDPATGKILWQTPDPSHNASGGGNALGPVTVDGYSRLGIPGWTGSTTFYDFSINGH